MGILDEIEAEAAGTKRPCKLHFICEQLGEDDGAELREALMNDNIPFLAIVRVLKARGINVADVTIRRHRMKACSCESW